MIILATFLASSSLKPLLVIAGVPILNPLVTNGLLVSPGMDSLLVVMFTESSKFCASFPVTPVLVISIIIK